MERLSNIPLATKPRVPLSTKPREFVLFISLQGRAKRTFINHRVGSFKFGWMARSSLKRATERRDVSPLETQFSSRIRMGKGISRAIHRKGKMLYRFCCRAALTRLLRSRLLCRFLDAGMPTLSTRSCGRRPKSAKARNRGTCGGAAPRVLWGFCRRFRLAEVGLKRSPQSACGETWPHASV